MLRQRPSSSLVMVSIQDNASPLPTQLVEPDTQAESLVLFLIVRILATLTMGEKREVRRAVAATLASPAALATAPTGTTASEIGSTVYPGRLTAWAHQQPRQATFPVVPCGAD